MSFAFYDFDKTLLHGDAGPLFGYHLFDRRRHRIQEKHGARTATARKALMWTRIMPYLAWMGVQSALYKVRAVRRSTIVRSAYKGLKGVPVAVLEAELEHFVERELRPRFYPEMRQDMQAHFDAGRTCVIITTGMQRLVERCLPFLPDGTRVLGCRLEERDGRLTGRVEQGPLYGADKANIIMAYCTAAGVDPKDCFAYSDHYSDHQMLEVVGHGACINPAPRLAKMAQKEGWSILRLEDPRKAATDAPA